MSRDCCSFEDQPPSGKQASAAAEIHDTTSGDEPSGADGQTGADEHEQPVPWWRDRTILLPLLSGVLLALGYGLEWAETGVAALVVQLLSLLAGGATFVPGALRSLLRGRLGVGLLMTIGALGAVLLGRIGEAAALAFLFSIAEALEDRTMDRARAGLRALLAVIPETARVSRLSGLVTVPVSEVRVLDVLDVRPGERVPTDAIVVSGRSSLDTSAVTGESIPVAVAPGDRVPAGAINGQGSLELEATADGRDNSITTIVRLVQEAQARKGERARLADRIARPLVPIVLAIATLIVVFGFVVGDPGTWTVRALVVLVAASPCALAIAVPVTVVSAIGAASRFGVVVKSGEAFERLGDIRTVALDKTGTLTRNRPRVVAAHTVGDTDREQVLRTAAALEARSTHPLAGALLGEVPAPPAAADVIEHPGQGIAGTVGGVRARVGSTRWLPLGELEERAVELEAQGMTVMVVELDGAPAGVIGVRDELRPEAAEAIGQLHAAGITTLMITGDNERTASVLAARAGIDDVRAEQLPADKARAVESLSAVSPTAMIGDGINDAPALAAASVGIAMGAAGSAAAMESADVAFTGTDLRHIPQALAHARRGRRIMTQNIVLALAIIAGLFPLALFGVLGLAQVVLVHEIAEVVVILNGVRAARVARRLPALPAVEPAPPEPAAAPASSVARPN